MASIVFGMSDEGTLGGRCIYCKAPAHQLLDHIVTQWQCAKNGTRLPAGHKNYTAQELLTPADFDPARHPTLFKRKPAFTAITINDYAPEHLQIMSCEPMAWLGSFKNAGEILLGEYAPSTLGNFVLGPDAVLPTNRASRTHSPLSVFDFMKRTSVGYVTGAAYPELARHARVLARYEGFDAHENAISQLRDDLMKG